jgi:hypothetical protein
MYMHVLSYLILAFELTLHLFFSQKQRVSGKTVPEIGKLAAREWKKLSEAKKSIYQERFRTALSEYQNLMSRINSGLVDFSNPPVIGIPVEAPLLAWTPLLRSSAPAE